MEIIQERLEREYSLDLINTAPTVAYRVKTTSGTVLMVQSPAKLPPSQEVEEIAEPYILASIHMPAEFVGPVFALCEEKRGKQRELRYMGETRVVVEYELPLSEIVLDFYDRLKSVSRGYASFDYHIIGYEEGELVKMSLLVNDEPVDALSVIVHRSRAEARGRAMVEKLKDLIPRHLFKIPIQAAIGGKVIARETISALRKDVTAKCYGGDITRKRKLLDKQKAGKKKMRSFGKVDIPQGAFIAALKMDGN
jgi:GTP-binding protein LepA